MSLKCHTISIYIHGLAMAFINIRAARRSHDIDDTPYARTTRCCDCAESARHWRDDALAIAKRCARIVALATPRFSVVRPTTDERQQCRRHATMPPSRSLDGQQSASASHCRRHIPPNNTSFGSASCSRHDLRLPGYTVIAVAGAIYFLEKSAPEKMRRAPPPGTRPPPPHAAS